MVNCLKNDSELIILYQDCVSETFAVSPIGLNEQMVVEVEPVCDCPCAGDDQIEEDLLCQVCFVLLSLFLIKNLSLSVLFSFFFNSELFSKCFIIIYSNKRTYK